MKRAFKLIRELLRELADESAYERYLAAQGRTHSPEEWRRFSDARLRSRYMYPKCC